MCQQLGAPQRGQTTTAEQGRRITRSQSQASPSSFTNASSWPHFSHVQRFMMAFLCANVVSPFAHAPGGSPSQKRRLADAEGIADIGHQARF